jgi:hypothetical protein
MKEQRAKYVYYFCDESSFVDDEFMAVAGLAVPNYEMSAIIADLTAIKADKRGPTETKWSTVKTRRDSAHNAFADYWAEGIARKRFHFHIRFAPFDQYDHKLSGPNKRSDTVSKMHFQLLLHRAVRYYGRRYKLRIRPDNGDCTKDLKAQIEKLHRWSQENHDCAPDCVESIEPRDSRKELLLQLLDVPLGALTALRNDRNLIGPKRELADYVKAKHPALDLTKSTDIRAMVFNVWNVKPSGAPKGRGPWG